MKFRQLSAAVVLALMTALPFQAAEQYPPRILHSLNRSADFHPSQAAVFQFDVLQAIGGVLSQTSRLLAATGERGTFSITLDLESGEYPGYVIVRHAETTVPYMIEYSDLVPMALFVDSGGASLYTLWNEDDDRLPEDFQRVAGFVEHHVRGHVALEFNDTQYSDALYFIDRCRGCLGERDLNVGDGLTQVLRESSGERTGSSYINTDVGMPFIFSVDTGWVDLDGRIGRFHWDTSSSGASITALPVLREPAWDAIEASEVFTDLLRVTARPDVDVTISEYESLDFFMTATDISRQRLNVGFFLFETLALLRTAKTDAPDGWSEFMDLLSSEEMVETNPVPWDRYTRSVCAVYPNRTDCRS